jgi:hypothetical protein
VQPWPDLRAVLWCFSKLIVWRVIEGRGRPDACQRASRLPAREQRLGSQPGDQRVRYAEYNRPAENTELPARPVNTSSTARGLPHLDLDLDDGLTPAPSASTVRSFRIGLTVDI